MILCNWPGICAPKSLRLDCFLDQTKRALLRNQIRLRPGRRRLIAGLKLRPPCAIGHPRAPGFFKFIVGSTFTPSRTCPEHRLAVIEPVNTNITARKLAMTERRSSTRLITKLDRRVDDIRTSGTPLQRKLRKFIPYFGYLLSSISEDNRLPHFDKQKEEPALPSAKSVVTKTQKTLVLTTRLFVLAFCHLTMNFWRSYYFSRIRVEGFYFYPTRMRWRLL